MTRKLSPAAKILADMGFDPANCPPSSFAVAAFCADRIATLEEEIRGLERSLASAAEKLCKESPDHA